MQQQDNLNYNLEHDIEELRSIRFIYQNEMKQRILLKRRIQWGGENCYEKYNQRKKKVQKLSIKHQIKEIVCPICMDILVNVATTICGHNFCERCIFEGLLRKPHCPICRLNIRNQQFMFSIPLKNHIKQIVNETTSEEEKINFYNREKENEEWNSSKTIKNIQKGTKLDVLDTEHIWCVGIIQDLQETQEDTQVLIHYEGWNKLYDEYLSINSYRLAPLGFFTKRRDIPRYMPSDGDEALQNYIVYQNDGDGDQLATRLLSALFNVRRRRLGLSEDQIQQQTQPFHSHIMPPPLFLQIIQGNQQQQQEPGQNQPQMAPEQSTSDSLSNFFNPQMNLFVIHSFKKLIYYVGECISQ